jgi:hypothetical protein
MFAIARLTGMETIRKKGQGQFITAPGGWVAATDDQCQGQVRSQLYSEVTSNTYITAFDGCDV